MDVGVAHVELHRDDRQRRRRQSQPVAAAARFRWSPVERYVCGRKGRHEARLFAGRHRPRQRHAAAVGIVPGDPHVAIDAGRERQLGIRDALLRQVEKRSFALEHCPAGAIAAPLEPQPFQEGRRKARQSDAIDRLRGLEVHLETTGRLGRGHGEETTVQPDRIDRLVHQDVWNRLAGGVDQSKVLQSAVSEDARAAPRDTEGRTVRKQRNVDREPARPAASGLYRAAVCIAWLLPRDERSRPQQDQQAEHETADHHASLGFESTNFLSASDTSTSESASPTNDPTR